MKGHYISILGRESDPPLIGPFATAEMAGMVLTDDGQIHARRIQAFLGPNKYVVTSREADSAEELPRGWLNSFDPSVKFKALPEWSSEAS